MPPVCFRNKVYNASINDVIEVVNVCNSLLKDRFSICFDICHAISTINFWKILDQNKELTLEKYFELLAPLCKHVHWNTAIGIGTTKETHSIVVEENDAKCYVELMRKYNMNPDTISIEVLEQNYVEFKNSLRCEQILRAALKYQD